MARKKRKSQAASPAKGLVWGGIAGSALALGYGAVFSPSSIFSYVLMGALALVGLLCITWAFSHIEASRAAPVEYTGLVWAALLGFGVFGEVPTLWSLGSAGLIMLGCLLLVKR